MIKKSRAHPAGSGKWLKIPRAPRRLGNWLKNPTLTHLRVTGRYFRLPTFDFPLFLPRRYAFLLINLVPFVRLPFNNIRAEKGPMPLGADSYDR